jgi:hypothetical protein
LFLGPSQFVSAGADLFDRLIACLETWSVTRLKLAMSSRGGHANAMHQGGGEEASSGTNVKQQWLVVPIRAG